MNTSYTRNLEENLWKFAYSIDESSEADEHYAIINYLNASDKFRSFGDGLLSVVQSKYPIEEIDKTTVSVFLEMKCKENGVSISDIAKSSNTLKNWFMKGIRPKKGETSRKSMFAIAFALGLTVDETKDLFHKVYLDRAFNYRNEKEVIYYYCLQQKRTWEDARKLIASLTMISTNEIEVTRYTAIIKDEIEQISNDDELLSYIANHRADFERDSKTAKDEFTRLLTEAKTTALREIESPEYQELNKGKWRSEDTFSINSLYDIIIGFNVSAKKGTKTIFGKSRLPKEIKNRFPEAASFGKKDIGSEELRKVIILLFSYVTWSNVQSSDMDYEYDDYKAELDALLSECNYSNMYYGNPYDWLFLYCTSEGLLDEEWKHPLAVFRELIAEALESE